jgi:hypothetical protein
MHMRNARHAIWAMHAATTSTCMQAVLLALVIVVVGWVCLGVEVSGADCGVRQQSGYSISTPAVHAKEQHAGQGLGPRIWDLQEALARV